MMTEVTGGCYALRSCSIFLLALIYLWHRLPFSSQRMTLQFCSEEIDFGPHEMITGPVVRLTSDEHTSEILQIEIHLYRYYRLEVVFSTFIFSIFEIILRRYL
jgi:hypothetical protein